MTSTSIKARIQMASRTGRVERRKNAKKKACEQKPRTASTLRGMYNKPWGDKWKVGNPLARGNTTQIQALVLRTRLYSECFCPFLIQQASFRKLFHMSYAVQPPSPSLPAKPSHYTPLANPNFIFRAVTDRTYERGGQDRTDTGSFYIVLHIIHRFHIERI